MSRLSNKQRRHKRDKRREQRARNNAQPRESAAAPELSLELRLELTALANQRAFEAQLAKDIADLETRPEP